MALLVWKKKDGPQQETLKVNIKQIIINLNKKITWQIVSNGFCNKIRLLMKITLSLSNRVSFDLSSWRYLQLSVSVTIVMASSMSRFWCFSLAVGAINQPPGQDCGGGAPGAEAQWKMEWIDATNLILMHTRCDARHTPTHPTTPKPSSSYPFSSFIFSPYVYLTGLKEF